MFGFLKYWKRFFAFLIVIALLFAIIVLSIVVFKKDYDLKQLTEDHNNEKELTENLNKEKTELQTKVAGLEAKLNIFGDNYGAISGKITAVLNINQETSSYQLVCATNAENALKQYCVSVTSVNPEYSISLPAGKYIISSRILDDAAKINTGYIGYYSEYINCNQNTSNSQECEGKSNNPFVVDVKESTLTDKINPIDWKSVKN